MYNSGNSSKNVTGASVVDGTLENADFADNTISGDKIDGGTISGSVTLVTPDIGTPSAGVLTNCSGTASSLTTGNVTTNANLTGVVTSSGNATAIADNAISGDKIDAGVISNFQSTGIDDRLPTAKILTLKTTGVDVTGRVLVNHSTNAGISFTHTNGSDSALRQTSTGSLVLEADTGNETASSRIEIKVDGTERMRITANGLTFNGDTAAANALDDYEEGTWTASINGASAAAAQTARYTKIGNVVTAYAYISSITNTNNSTQFQITGLPFATAAASLASGVTIGWSNAADLSNWRGITNSSSNNFYFSDAVTGATKTHANAQSAGITHLIFTITYRSA
jgi:hypothetical protein